MGKTHTEILNEIHAMREPELKVPKGIADRKRVVSLIKEIQVVLLPGYFNKDPQPAGCKTEKRKVYRELRLLRIL